MVRKAARTVKSLEKPQTESPTTRTRSRRHHKSESDPESEEDVAVSSFKNDLSEESESEYEKKSRRSGRSTRTKKSKQREKTPTSDDNEEEELTERKSEKGKSKNKNKRKSRNHKNSETENENVQESNQSACKDDKPDETITSNLTETSNLPQPDNQKHDSGNSESQQTETTNFSSINVDGESTSETVESGYEEKVPTDPLADPFATLDDTNESQENGEQLTKIGTESTESDQHPEEIVKLNNEESNKEPIVEEPLNEKSSPLRDEQKNTEDHPENKNEPSKSEEVTQNKKIHLKRPLSEKKNKMEKIIEEKSEQSNEVVEKQVEDTAKEDSMEVDNKNEEQAEKEVKETRSKRKITLKRPSESRQTSVEEKKVSDVNETKTEEANMNNDTDNKEGIEEGEWSSSYEVNGQDDSENKKQKENDKDHSSRQKISLKRRTTEEKDGYQKSRDKPERSISLNDSRERRRSRRESASDFEIKKRPSKNLDRSISENDEKIITSVKPKKPTKVVKINRAVLKAAPKESENDLQTGENKENQEIEIAGEEGLTVKKFKWGTSEADLHDKLLDLEIVKNVCPSVEFLNEEEVDLELSSLEKRRLEIEQRKQLALERKQEEIEEEVEAEDESIPVEERENILAKNRNISIVEDTASKLKPPPSPAKNPVSNIVYVSNLVRPFTVRQLRELLERTGTIKEDGFWTDKIKSKCYVVYETREEAEATRNALHGVNWPIGNGKQLIIEYATEEEMERAKNPPPPARRAKTPEKENKIPDNLDDIKLREGEAAATRDDWSSRRRDSGGDRSRDVEGHRRGHARDERDGARRHSRSRSRERTRKHSRRSVTPEDHHHKRKRQEELVEQKAMDDLFMKTKAVPSIYWQPLSPEEIAQKQRQREARLEENRRRMEERPRQPHIFRDRSFRRR